MSFNIDNYETFKATIPNYRSEPFYDEKDNNEPRYLFQYEQPTQEIDALLCCTKCGARLQELPKVLHTTDTGAEHGIIHVWISNFKCENGCRLDYFDLLKSDGTKAYDYEPIRPSYYEK